MIVTTFPRAVRVIEHTSIPLKDGTRLAARIWLPEDAEQHPVPALLEYLPYRKRDGTLRARFAHPSVSRRPRLCLRAGRYPRLAANRTACCPTSTRRQEQDDALEVIAWLAAQPWCSGAVGMFGISWGGFNALQVAARRPPALKAIVTICSTDDRYADDVHYMGGAKLECRLRLGGVLLRRRCAIRPIPRWSASAGGRCGWSGWRTLPLFLEIWLRHQRRDAYWRHGSVCEDYARDPVSGLRGRRLDRRLHQRHSAPARTARGAAQGADRAVGPCLSAFRAARPADRLPAGDAALVGPLAEGPRHRRRWTSRCCAPG